jgi:hypothetical protein
MTSRMTETIPYSKSRTGGHAFAIVAFDERGFWIQNSWGKTWDTGIRARLLR